MKWVGVHDARDGAALVDLLLHGIGAVDLAVVGDRHVGEVIELAAESPHRGEGRARAARVRRRARVVAAVGAVALSRLGGFKYLEEVELKNNFRLPNLFIPGAGKSGTSTLHAMLDQHPKICMSSIKEPQFWTSKNFNDFSKTDFENYSALFSWNGNYTYFGESSTSYMCFPEFIERIKDYNLDDSKFIFVLRNPIDRCYSHYWWLKGMGSETRDLKSAFLHDKDQAPSNQTRLPENGFKNYYQFGLYAKWMTYFYANFKKENILFITHEALKKDPLLTLNTCFKFLAIDSLESIETLTLNKTTIFKNARSYYWAKRFAYKRYNIPNSIRRFLPSKLIRYMRDLPRNTINYFGNKSYEYPEMTAKERIFLKSHYAEDVASLKSLVTYDFPEWKDFN